VLRTDPLELMIDTRITGTMWTATPLAAASGNAQTLEVRYLVGYYSLTWLTCRAWKRRQFSESPVNFYQKTRRNIPECSVFHSYCRENLKSNTALSQNLKLPCTSCKCLGWKWLYTSVSTLLNCVLRMFDLRTAFHSWRTQIAKASNAAFNLTDSILSRVGWYAWRNWQILVRMIAFISTSVTLALLITIYTAL
jgi:hypothetical protein